MSRTKRLCSGLLFALLGGCSTMNNTEAGALGGGVIGGALGTVVGVAMGRPLAGAAIGAGSGALIGGASGNAEDRFERRQAQAYANAVRNPPLPLSDIVELSQRGTPDDIIIRQIASSGSIYQLSAADIAYLRDHRVSDNVVRAMQSPTPMAVPMARPGAVYVVEPPPPPVAVGVGFGYCRPRYRRCW